MRKFALALIAALALCEAAQAGCRGGRCGGFGGGGFACAAGGCGSFGGFGGRFACGPGGCGSFGGGFVNYGAPLHFGTPIRHTVVGYGMPSTAVSYGSPIIHPGTAVSYGSPIIIHPGTVVGQATSPPQPTPGSFNPRPIATEPILVRGPDGQMYYLVPQRRYESKIRPATD